MPLNDPKYVFENEIDSQQQEAFSQKLLQDPRFNDVVVYQCGHKYHF